MSLNRLAEPCGECYTGGVGRPGSVNFRAALSNSHDGGGHLPERYSTSPSFPVNRTSLWCLSHRFDREVLPLADRHYNRQAIGSPQFAPPGRCLVLKTALRDAFWVTSWPLLQFTKHEWAGAWICSAFRNESPTLSSELIASAVAATRWRWRVAPLLGMVTFVDAAKVRHKRDPGRCYLRAGFKRVGETAGGLVALQLLPDDMPEPSAPWPASDQLSLFDAEEVA